jgi:tRNA(Ile)-lysidine synthase
MEGVEIVCAHVNHGLRGEDADADERFVVDLAAAIGAPAVVRAVDVRQHAAECKLSIETAARRLRLGTLACLARENGCTWIATGHQKNDNAETLVHRLGRGTGLRGLAGIPPARPVDDELWLGRPLLDTTRADVIAYLRSHGRAWREDRTNADPGYTRNRIRHRLLPEMQRAAQGSLVDALCDLADVSLGLRNRIDAEARTAWQEWVRMDRHAVAVDARGLAALPQPVAVELIRRAVVHLGGGERDLTERHYTSVLSLARGSTNPRKLALPQHRIATRKDDALVLSVGHAAQGTAQRSPQAVQIPGTTQAGPVTVRADLVRGGERDHPPARPSEERWSEWFDFDRIEPPLVVRSRLPGDRFWPLGAEGLTRAGRFLSAAKVAAPRRNEVLIFADRRKIVWLCPVRISEKAKLTAGTRRMLHLTVARRPASHTREVRE